MIAAFPVVAVAFLGVAVTIRVVIAVSLGINVAVLLIVAALLEIIAPAQASLSRSLSLVPGEAFPIAPYRAMNQFSPRSVSFSMQESPRRPTTILPPQSCNRKPAGIIQPVPVKVTEKVIPLNDCWAEAAIQCSSVFTI